MTAPTGAPETELRCTHDPAARCWLCSDKVSWWRDARIKAGLGEEPPACAVKAPEPSYWGNSSRAYRTMSTEEESAWREEMLTPRSPEPVATRSHYVPGAGWTGPR